MGGHNRLCECTEPDIRLYRIWSLVEKRIVLKDDIECRNVECVIVTLGHIEMDELTHIFRHAKVEFSDGTTKKGIVAVGDTVEALNEYGFHALVIDFY